MSGEVWVAGRLRKRWDDAARKVRVWDDTGTEQAPVDYTPAENADADVRATQATRETNRAILMDRAQAAIAANLTALTVAQGLEVQGSFNNSQRDDALRFLAATVGSLLKENNALIRLVVAAVRADALDATE